MSNRHKLPEGTSLIPAISSHLANRVIVVAASVNGHAVAMTRITGPAAPVDTRRS